MTTLISIIIPIYKVEEYVERCLQSVMSQTFTDGIECIVVDDCTPDRSMEIAERMIADYKGPMFFSIVKREENGGLSAARNSGIKVAKGRYLYFLDSDDWITPNCMEVFYSLIKKYPQAQILQAAARMEGARQGVCANIQNVNGYCDDKDTVKRRMLRYIYGVTAWNKLINRQWLLGNNLFFKEGLLHEDNYWTYFASKCASKYVSSREVTYIYYLREGSITMSPSTKNLDSLLLSMRDFMDNIDGNCRKSQIDMIFCSTYLNYATIDDEIYRQRFADLLVALYHKSPLSYRILIRTCLAMPYNWNRNGFVKFLISRIITKIYLLI